MPSALLERRPDIAEAERQVAAANEQIGIAKAAFFPTLTLTATAGVESSQFPQLDYLAQPLLVRRTATGADALRRRQAPRPGGPGPGSATTPPWPTTGRPCLTAFQQVEDNLAALRILADESAVLDRAVSSAERSVTISTAQYKGGVASYLQVITVQAIALANQRAAIDVQTRRMTASVLLIEALGGGWNASQLPSIQDVSGR